MGLNVCWMAVSGFSRTDLLDRFGLEEAGETTNELGVRYACAQLPGGWTLLTVTDRSFPFEKAVVTASAAGVVIGCEVGETAMWSHSWAIDRGSQLWSVLHDGGKDRDSVRVEGRPPSAWDEIVSRAQALQTADGGADYLFETPIQLAAEVCGYTAGSWQSEHGAFAVLRPKGQGRRGDATRMAPSALSTAIRVELVPLARSLGWRRNAGRGEFDFERERPGRLEHMWLDFASDELGARVWVSGAAWGGRDGLCVSFSSVIVRARRKPEPLWRVLTGLRRRQPVSSADPIGDAIKEGAERINILEAFLQHETNHLDLRILRGRGTSFSWPDGFMPTLAGNP